MNNEGFVQLSSLFIKLKFYLKHYNFQIVIHFPTPLLNIEHEN